jgi:hypothetical protein
MIEPGHLPRFRPSQLVRLRADAAPYEREDDSAVGEVVAIRPSNESLSWLVTIDFAGRLDEFDESSVEEVSPANGSLFPLILEGLPDSAPPTATRGDLLAAAQGVFRIAEFEYEERPARGEPGTFGFLRLTPAEIDSVSAFEQLVNDLGSPEDVFDDGWAAEAHWAPITLQGNVYARLSLAVRPWEFQRRRQLVLGQRLT